MCDIDFNDSCERNIKYWAKQDAQYDHIYEQERNKLNRNTTTSVTLFNNRQSNNDNKIDVLERRLDKLEKRVDMIEDKLVRLNESPLFVYDQSRFPSSGIQLSPQQFKELINEIMK